MKINSGKLKIQSGKLFIENPPVFGINVRFEIMHYNIDSQNSIVARYSVGLTNTVSYSSGYLFRGETTLEADSEGQLNIEGFVPGAVASDGVVDCYFYAESTTTDAAFAIGGFADEVEEGQPNTVNNRFPIKFAAGTQAEAGGSHTCTVTPEDLEWEIS
tara:strand:- start:58 stop:534 length:477 start_codon:yes stop_codon:yes gene_type:complete